MSLRVTVTHFVVTGGPPPRHVPGRVSLAERTFRKHAVHRIDDEVAALGGSRARSKTDTLGRGAAEDDCFDAAVFQALIEIVAHEFIRSAWFLIEKLALARGDGLVDDFAAAGQGVGDEHAGSACPVMQRLDRRDRCNAARTLATIFVHEVQQEQCGGLGVDRHRLQRRRRRHLNCRPFSDNIGGARRRRSITSRGSAIAAAPKRNQPGIPAMRSSLRSGFLA